ncbi:hypothetical protein DENSPDRAFT_434481 [Dentipellis sp. KUC8613]|nr:hypothetical protein DENSPDRAFT_434481 [Dentipellis sp. KUC8613]
MLVGAWLSCVMWGVSCAQTFLYLSRYWDKDSWKKKGLVLFLWCVDTANEILLLQPLWHVLIANFGNIPVIFQIQPGLTHHAWVAGIVTFSVQLFFVHRMYKFSGCRWYIPAFLALLSLFQLVVLIPYNVLTVSGGSNTTSGIEKSWATDMLISLRSVTAAEDIIITATMTFLVLKHGLPEFRATRRMIYRFILVTFNTGFWTAVAAIVELAMVARNPTGLQFMVPEGPLCSLYFSAFLANLNSREFIKGENFTSWNDWEVDGGGRSGSGSAASGSNAAVKSRPGATAFRLGVLGRKGGGSGGMQSGTLTVKVDTMQISDSDAREGSMDEMQYKYKPEAQVCGCSPASKHDSMADAQGRMHPRSDILIFPVMVLMITVF